jgi:Flp pilus assembly protein TadD
MANRETPASNSAANLRRLLAFAVFAVVWLVFSRTLANGFVDWDDQEGLLDNPNYRGLLWSNLSWMFTTTHMGHYQPLSWMTLALDYLASSVLFGDGLDPRCYHFTNNTLHALNAVMVYFLLVQLIGRAGSRAAYLSCAVAAGLFALHPLRVESVAWITERRDVLSSFWLLATVLIYLHAQAAQPNNRRKLLRWSLVTYLLSLLSRSMGVTLPIILLLLDWYPLQRLRTGLRAALIEKSPYIVLAAIFAAAAMHAQKSVHAVLTFEEYGVLPRIAQAAYGLVFYLWKLVFPTRLCPIYEIHMPPNPVQLKYIGSAVLVVIASTLAVATRRRWPEFALAWTCHVVLLLPVLGFFQSGQQEVADRYSYLPSIIWAGLLGYLLSRWGERKPVGRALVPVCVTILSTLSVLTWWQCSAWANAETFWTHTIATADRSSVAENGYGNILLTKGRHEEAVGHFQRALEILPENFRAHKNLWSALNSLGRESELEAAYREAIRLDVNASDALNNLGNMLSRRGDHAGAVDAYRSALEKEPIYAKANMNLGLALARLGDQATAEKHLRLAIEQDGTMTLARFNFAQFLRKNGRLPEAREVLQAAAKVDPADEKVRRALESWFKP